MAKNKQKKSKGPQHRNENFSQNDSKGNPAPKIQDKKQNLPVEAKAAEAKAQRVEQAESADSGQKSFFSNIADSVKKLIKQSS